MALPTPKLDDRTFQDLVDEAKRLIPTYCPGWTDHNVSDPGITLIELFAYMTEQYLYRLNQVPEKNYVSFLNLLGGLEPPRAARGTVTFTLAQALASDAPFNIPKETELATVRTETEDAIVFTTDREAQVMPPRLAWILTTKDRDKDDWKEPEKAHNFPAWPQQDAPPPPFPALALGFGNDLSAHTVAFIIELEKSADEGKPVVDCQWQVYRGEKPYDNNPWVTLEVASDSTNNLRQSGEVILYLPDHCLEGKLGKYEARIWVRCSPRDTYTPPEIKSVRAETRGITVPVTQAQVIENEVMGTSNGRLSEIFSLLHHPILAPRDPDDGSDVDANADEWVVEVEVKDNPDNEKQWKPVDKSICRIDPVAGVVEFAHDRCSVIPTRGRRIRVRRYRTSAAELGNVSMGKISVIKSTSLQGIKSVTNRLRTSGGRAAQTLEDAQRRSPVRERLRQRAVTTEDFEVLAQQVPGVGGVRCLPDQNGNVKLLVIPDLPRLNDDVIDEYIRIREGLGKDKRVDLAIPELIVPIETKDRLWAAMQPRLLLGSNLIIEMPQYAWIRVEVDLTISKMASPGTSTRVIQDVKRRLYRWFHPLYGGEGGKGWQLKQPLREDKVWMLIGGTPGIESIDAINLYRYELQASFKIAEQSLENLKLENVPDGVLKELERIKDQEDRVEEEFLATLERILGKERIVQYKSFILNNTELKEQKRYVRIPIGDPTAPRPYTFNPEERVITCLDHAVRN
jgi:hypothetical protein